MLSAEALSAICVQRFDGSRNSAIHTTYRISLRSSSLREPRYPLYTVVFGWIQRPGRLHFNFRLVLFGVNVGLDQPTNPKASRPAQDANECSHHAPNKREARQFGSQCWY